MNIDKVSIRKRALHLIYSGAPSIASVLAREFGLSRQVANGYLQAMVRDGLIQAEGTTRARVYKLQTTQEKEQSYPRAGLQEDMVWREVISPVVKSLSENVSDIWFYSSTEIINNAIDHSGSPTVSVTVRTNALFAEVIVADEGEGIFRRIQRALNLDHTRDAILELAKGKLTTAPEGHSGEGIFFTSRSLDLFEIESHDLRFTHAQGSPDSIQDQANDIPGTRVRMRLENDSSRKLRDVFDAYQDSDEASFDKTVVPLRLAQYEREKLVSRSQAKRVANRFEHFKSVELDFTGISEIGQGFADELFRVFTVLHPGIRLVPTHTEPAVAQMIRRVTANAASASRGTEEAS